MYWCMQNGRKNDRKNEKSSHKIFVLNLGADGRQNKFFNSVTLFIRNFFSLLSEQHVSQKLSIVYR